MIDGTGTGSTAMNRNENTEFGTILRHWRESRRFSQLDLALQADVSSKHVSFLETGRNRPSRDMILRLANAMDVPLRDRNLMLTAAGFADAYGESSLDSPSITLVQEALRRLLDKHEPYPAFVLDADWHIVRQNRAASAMAACFLENPVLIAGKNALEILFSPEGLQPFVLNWERLSSVLLMRIFRESVSPSGRASSRELLEHLLAMPTAPSRWRELASGEPSGPTLDLELKKGDASCRFFTTVTTFGTPQDVTLQELRIEQYFPADDATDTVCRNWAATRSP